MDTNYFKQKLKAEKSVLEKELDHLGVRTPGRKDDWQAQPDDISPINTKDEMAERLETWDERLAAERSLETRLISVNQSLDRIAEGTYGHCLLCNQMIETDRLRANPAAATCKTHIDEESK